MFDLDGTLVDSVPGIGAALAAAFRSLGRTMPAGLLRKAIGPPIRVIAKRLEPELTDAEASAIEAAYRQLYDNEGWRETRLFPGVEAGLRMLHEEGHRLLIATNKPRIPTMKIVEHLGMNEFVEDLVTRDSAKPDYKGKGEMVAALIARHGLRPNESVMVGDTEEDGEAARANGLRFAFVSYGYGEAESADYRFQAFSELPRMAGRMVAAVEVGQ